MLRFRLLALAVPALLLALPAAAQYAPAGTSDADQLASEMRLLAADPTNLDGLIRAGQLSLRLGDVTAAAAFFTRAERISPNDPRVKAGEGSLLVQAERPGEALRRFADAERLGFPAQNFAADRGLAYDLIGEQDRAQRDYRLAQRSGTGNDETVRRYALSLAISGRGDLAEAQLEPLLRRSDRAAWRVRAFILAMGGDQAGADRIAVSMMPPGFAAGLRPFFQRLPTLSPADRAFAVNFGEIHATPDRVADARLVPPFPVLAADPYAPAAPVRVTAAAPPASNDRHSRRDRRDRRDRTQVAALAPLPAPPSYVTPASVAPTAVYVRAVPAPAYQPLPRTSIAAISPSPVRPRVSGTFAASSPGLHAGAPGSSTDLGRGHEARLVPQVSTRTAVPVPGLAAVPERAAPLVIASRPTPVVPPPVAVSGSIGTASSTSSYSLPAAAATTYTPQVLPPTQGAAVTTTSVEVTPMPVPIQTPAGASPVSAAAPSIALAANPAAPPPVPTRTAPEFAAPAAPIVSGTAPSTPLATGDSAPVPATAIAAPVDSDAAEGAPLGAQPVAVAAPVRSESAILSSIISNMGVPATELGVAPLRHSTAVPVRATGEEPPPIAMAAPSPALASVPASRTPPRVTAPPPAAVSRTRRGEPALASVVVSTAPARRSGHPGDIEDQSRSQTATGRRSGRAAVEDEALPANGRRESVATTARSRRNDPLILYPARTWVQVAGGASERDLARAWADARSKAPAAFRGRQAWTVPVRATNRVLAGPFETQAQAQVFLNQIVHAGRSGFIWNSQAGQEIDRLTTP